MTRNINFKVLQFLTENSPVTKEVEAAKEYWATVDMVNLRRNKWTQAVPDDPTGVGIVDGIYKCLQRDYCHDFRPFQLFNFEGAAHILTSNVLLVIGGLLAWTLLILGM